MPAGTPDTLIFPPGETPSNSLVAQP